MKKTVLAAFAAALLSGPTAMQAAAASPERDRNIEVAVVTYVEHRLSDDLGADVRVVGKPYVIVYRDRSGERRRAEAVDVRVTSRVHGQRMRSRHTVLLAEGEPFALASDMRRRA